MSPKRTEIYSSTRVALVLEVQGFPSKAAIIVLQWILLAKTSEDE